MLSGNTPICANYKDGDDSQGDAGDDNNLDYEESCTNENDDGVEATGISNDRDNLDDSVVEPTIMDDTGGEDPDVNQGRIGKNLIRYLESSDEEDDVVTEQPNEQSNERVNTVETHVLFRGHYHPATRIIDSISSSNLALARADCDAVYLISSSILKVLHRLKRKNCIFEMSYQINQGNVDNSSRVMIKSTGCFCPKMNVSGNAPREIRLRRFANIKLFDVYIGASK